LRASPRATGRSPGCGRSVRRRIDAGRRPGPVCGSRARTRIPRWGLEQPLDLLPQRAVAHVTELERLREESRTIAILVALLREQDDPILFGIADHAHRAQSLLPPFELLEEQRPEQHDAAIRGGEVLARPIRNGALRDPGHDVLPVDVVDYEVAALVAPRNVVDGDRCLRLQP